MTIKLDNLEKTYSGAGGNVAAVDGVSLEIAENEIFGIIGKSGAGKSSLVRLISLLETPDRGQVFYGDERVDNLTKDELIQKRRSIGMIFQNFNLFSSRTAAKNIAYPLEICGYPKDKIEARVDEMLSLVGLEGRGNSPVSTLSGGQKQRIAIARALATKPKILFCDEATSALDPQTTKSILNLIREIQKKMQLTVVMITHQMEVVRDACDRVAVIDAGKIVEMGKVSDVFSNPASDVTKEFISHITSVESSRTAGKEMVRWSDEGGEFVLRFVGKKTGEPVISSLVKKVGVDLNIRAGGIQHLVENDVGTMIIDIDGQQDKIAAAVEYLEGEGIIVEKVSESEVK